MIKTVLVPLDGSKCAEQGLAMACRIAQDTGATLFLVRAILYYGLMRENEALERESLREARAYLRDQEQLLIAAGFTVRTEVVPTDAVQAVLFAADMYNADLIVMSTHGATGVRHAVLGSVTEAVLRRSRRPVLVVRASEKAIPEISEPIAKVLVPLDGTQFSEAALTFLSSGGIGRSGRIIVLRVVPPTTVTTSTMIAGDALVQMFRQAEAETEEHRLAAESYLAAAGLAHLRELSWRPRVSVGYPQEDIRTIAQEEHCDLIVMTTHGRHGVDRLLHGSVGLSLLHHCDVPMLLLSAPCVANHHLQPEKSTQPAAV